VIFSDTDHDSEDERVLSQVVESWVSEINSIGWDSQRATKRDAGSLFSLGYLLLIDNGIFTCVKIIV